MPKNEVEILQYQPIDALNINFRDKKEVQQILSVNPLYFQQLSELCLGNVFSIVRDKKILVIMGWTEEMYFKFATMFLFACEDLEKEFDTNVLRAINKIMDFVKLSHERVQATCVENKRNKRFLEFLGFQQECLMRKAGFDNSDLYLYSIIQ